MSPPKVQRFCIDIKAMPKKRPRFSGGRGRLAYNLGAYTAWKSEVARQMKLRAIPIGDRYAILSADIYRSIPKSKVSKVDGAPTPSGMRICDTSHPSWSDADNLIGAIMDAGNGVLWDDDQQLDIGSVRRIWSVEDMIVVTLKLADYVGWNDERREDWCRGLRAGTVYGD